MNSSIAARLLNTIRPIKARQLITRHTDQLIGGNPITIRIINHGIIPEKIFWNIKMSECSVKCLSTKERTKFATIFPLNNTGIIYIKNMKV